MEIKTIEDLKDRVESLKERCNRKDSIKKLRLSLLKKVDDKPI
jgi:hypothetical protein